MLSKIQSCLKIETIFVFIEVLYLRIHQISDSQVILFIDILLSWSPCHLYLVAFIIYREMIREDPQHNPVFINFKNIFLLNIYLQLVFSIKL